MRIERNGAAVVVTLDRPSKLNAINSVMRRLYADAMHGWADDPLVYGVLIRAAPARAFCAGGDILELYSQIQADPERAFRIMAKTYALVWQLECFGKPTVSFIDGTVMGFGVGLTLFGTHRVAGPGYQLQMQETAIGFFPDVGIAHTFSRLPRHIGDYLGLTGRPVGRADAYRLGLATHCIAADLYPEIEARYAQADTIDPLLDERHVSPGPAPLEVHEDAIDRCFSADSVEEIIARLAAETSDAAWCAGVIADLGRRSPLSLKVALRHIRRARHLDLRQTLAVDQRIACRLLQGHDFGAAVRALLIEKTGRTPQWRPQRLGDVTDAMVDRVFAPMPGAELVLPTIQEL